MCREHHGQIQGWLRSARRRSIDLSIDVADRRGHGTTEARQWEWVILWIFSCPGSDAQPGWNGNASEQETSAVFRHSALLPPSHSTRSGYFTGSRLLSFGHMGFSLPVGILLPPLTSVSNRRRKPRKHQKFLGQLSDIGDQLPLCPQSLATAEAFLPRVIGDSSPPLASLLCTDCSGKIPALEIAPGGFQISWQRLTAGVSQHAIYSGLHHSGHSPPSPPLSHVVNIFPPPPHFQLSPPTVALATCLLQRPGGCLSSFVMPLCAHLKLPRERLPSRGRGEDHGIRSPGACASRDSHKPTRLKSVDYHERFAGGVIPGGCLLKETLGEYLAQEPPKCEMCEPGLKPAQFNAMQTKASCKSKSQVRTGCTSRH